MNTDLPTPNIPLLRKAVEWAEAEAAKTDGTCQWNQGNYAWKTTCGTAYCIAGYVVAISDLPDATQEVMSSGCVRLWINGELTCWADAADELLGLTDEEGDALYWGTNTVAEVRAAAEQIAARAGERL